MDCATQRRRAHLEHRLNTQQRRTVSTYPLDLTGNLTGCIRARSGRAAIVVALRDRAGGIRTQRFRIYYDWETIVRQRGIDSSI